MTREEALKQIRNWSLPKETREVLETLIPELRESEDERIRKWILEKVQGYADSGIPCSDEIQMANKALAYLEKQKYDRMKPIYDAKESFESALEKAWKSYNDSGARTVDGCEDDYVECAHAKGFREGFLYGLEKQKEQKPAVPAGKLSREEYLYQLLIDQLITYSDYEYLTGKKPAEWGEEDEKMLLSIINTFRNGTVSTIGQEQWLKSLPERFNLQPIQEWSDEDEKIWHNIIWILKKDVTYTPPTRPNSCTGSGNAFYTHQTEIDWLKSLRPQPHWKPSEEQMDSLRDTIVQTKGYSYSIYLPELYEQLKKLM